MMTQTHSRFNMDENYERLIEILESSVKKHGEKPLTNKWLLNILKKAEKQQIGEEDNFWLQDPNFD